MTNAPSAYPIVCAQKFGSLDPSALPPLIQKALADPATELLRSVLGRANLTIESIPILWKTLKGKFLRIMFPVRGAKIEPGAVVSIVLLYDMDAQRTLYAHPMHAGPDTNPLLKHLDGPMAAPKAQTSADGDRATKRLLEHKRALWDQFCRDCDTVGAEQAGLRWRQGYYWSLRRLYFCSRCTECKWGTPFFDGPDPAVPRKATCFPAMPDERWSLSDGDARIRSKILNSEAWTIETRYAMRGGFRTSCFPRLIHDLSGGYQNWLFETDAAILQAGSIVALNVLYDRAGGGVCFAHCLSAGPDAELLFMHGDRAMALPLPQRQDMCERARREYARWRKKAWSQFWLDELAGGLEEASHRWLDGFWQALDIFFGGPERNVYSHTQVLNG